MKKIQLERLTGEALKALLEQEQEDGRINTIPELLKLLEGIPEGQTLKELLTTAGGLTDEDRQLLETVRQQAVTSAWKTSA